VLAIADQSNIYPTKSGSGSTQCIGGSRRKRNASKSVGEAEMTEGQLRRFYDGETFQDAAGNFINPELVKIVIHEGDLYRTELGIGRVVAFDEPSAEAYVFVRLLTPEECY
jgi:hypothetical protein